MSRCKTDLVFADRTVLWLGALLALTLPAGKTASAEPSKSTPWINAGVVANSSRLVSLEPVVRIYQQFAKAPMLEGPDRLLTEAMARQCPEERSVAEAERDFLQARADARRADWGLNLEAAARRAENLSGGNNAAANDQPDLGGNTVGGPSYVGLSWDVLESGYLAHRRQAEAIESDLKVKELTAEKEDLASQLNCRHTFLIAHFNRIKMKVLGLREEFLTWHRELYRDAYFSGVLDVEDVLEIDRDLQQTRQRIDTYRAFNTQFGEIASSSADEPYLLTFDVAPIVDALRNNPAAEQVASLHDEKLDAQYDPWARRRLQIYARPGVRWGSTHEDEVDMYLGALFSMPLLDDRDKEKAQERRFYREQEAFERKAGFDELLKRYTEFGYKLDDAIKLHYQRELELERLRQGFAGRELSHREAGDLQRLLQSMRDLLDTQLELLENKQMLYVRLLEMFSRSGVAYRPEWVRKVDFERPYNRARFAERKNPPPEITAALVPATPPPAIERPSETTEAAAETAQTAPVASPAATTRETVFPPAVRQTIAMDRSVYIWSDSFNAHPNSLLIQLLQTKSIGKAIVSAGRRTEGAKLEEFLLMAGEAGIQVDILASDNDWLRNKDPDAIRHIARHLFAQTGRVHLDLEPHAFPDFRARRDEYIEKFRQVLEIVKAEKPANGELAVSLPLLFTQEEINVLAPLADSVYVMAYGIRDPDKLLSKMAVYGGVPAEKIVLALRPKDFGSELALEKMLTGLAEQSPFRRFALHDLKQLLAVSP